jgi:hypothetical protein
MGETGDPPDDNAPEMAVQALACDDPDLQAIKDQIAKADDPQLRAVLEQYLTRWFQYNQQSEIV